MRKGKQSAEREKESKAQSSFVIRAVINSNRSRVLFPLVLIIFGVAVIGSSVLWVDSGSGWGMSRLISASVQSYRVVVFVGLCACALMVRFLFPIYLVCGVACEVSAWRKLCLRQ